MFVNKMDLIDYDRLESLRRIANHDMTFLRRYMQAAFEDIEAAINDLQVSIKAGDVRAGRDALHKIDGTGSSVGATALLASAAAMRNYLTTTPDSDTAAALAELATVCTLTKSAMAALAPDSHSADRPK